MSIVKAALLGAASGGRAASGISNVLLKTTSNKWIKRAAIAGAVVELAGDKYPKAPSRLETRSMLFRYGTAATSAALASKGMRARLLTAGTAIGATYVGAQLGAKWRNWAPSRVGGPIPAALIEDAVVYALARSAR